MFELIIGILLLVGAFYLVTQGFMWVQEVFILNIADNLYIFLAGICFLLAGFILVYFKPHPAEKFFEDYRDGRITRKQAIEKISTTLYDRDRDGIPPAYQSKMMEKRVKALRKRVQEETGLVEDVIGYVKSKSRLE